MPQKDQSRLLGKDIYLVRINQIWEVVNNQNASKFVGILLQLRETRKALPRDVPVRKKEVKFEWQLSSPWEWCECTKNLTSP